MDKKDFGFWLEGLVNAQGITQDVKVGMVLRAAQELLNVSGAAVSGAARAVPHAVRPGAQDFSVVRLPRFCMHNVALVERCRDCDLAAPRAMTERAGQEGAALSSTSEPRAFAIMLPVTTEQVFIKREARQG